MSATMSIVSLHGAVPAFLPSVRRWRHDFGHGLAKAGDPKGRLGLAQLFKQGKAFGLEFGDVSFLH